MNAKAGMLKALRAAQRFVPVPSSGRVVLCYHLIGQGTGAEVDSSIADFRNHLDWLTAFVPVRPLAQVVEDTQPGVALTFDDAFANFAERVWPELKERGLPCTLFVPTGFVDGVAPCPLSGENLKPCTWQQLREMRGEGLSLGSHTHRHEDLRGLSDRDIELDLSLAKRRLFDETGADAQALCYPQAKWDRRVERVVLQHHSWAVIAGGTHVFGRPRRVPRVPVRRGLTDLKPVFERGVWLEEWVADQARRARSPRSR